MKERERKRKRERDGYMNRVMSECVAATVLRVVDECVEVLRSWMDSLNVEIQML